MYTDYNHIIMYWMILHLLRWTSWRESEFSIWRPGISRWLAVLLTSVTLGKLQLSELQVCHLLKIIPNLPISSSYYTSRKMEFLTSSPLPNPKVTLCVNALSKTTVVRSDNAWQPFTYSQILWTKLKTLWFCPWPLYFVLIFSSFIEMTCNVLYV